MIEVAESRVFFLDQHFAIKVSHVHKGGVACAVDKQYVSWDLLVEPNRYKVANLQILGRSLSKSHLRKRIDVLKLLVFLFIILLAG